MDFFTGRRGGQAAISKARTSCLEAADVSVSAKFGGLPSWDGRLREVPAAAAQRAPGLELWCWSLARTDGRA